MHASIAERITYGRPYDPVADATLLPVVPRSRTALLGRILIAAIFVISGFAKLTDPAGAAGYMVSAGIPRADTLVYVAGAAELAGGLALIFGFVTRIAAIGLIVFLVIVQLYVNDFWAMPGPEAKTVIMQFWKDVSIIGGLFMIVAMGPGRFSIDARMRRPKAP